MTEITTRALLSELPPTEAELAAWHGLSREEQFARYREALQAPDAGRVILHRGGGFHFDPGRCASDP
jgi:hypothetical protein